jgi:hypothetical protein
MMSAILLAALVVTLATPARAEALEPFIIIGLATVAVAVLVVVVYLIVASASDSRGAAATDDLLPAGALVATAATTQTQ